jgi:hypothetical protein
MQVMRGHVISAAEGRGTRQADSSSRGEFSLLETCEKPGFDLGRPVRGNSAREQAKRARPGLDPAHPPCVRAGSGPGRSEVVETKIWRTGRRVFSEVVAGWEEADWGTIEERGAGIVELTAERVVVGAEERSDGDRVAISRCRVSERAMASRGSDGVIEEGSRER